MMLRVCVLLPYGPIVGRMTYRNMRSAGSKRNGFPTQACMADGVKPHLSPGTASDFEALMVSVQKSYLMDRQAEGAEILFHLSLQKIRSHLVQHVKVLIASPAISNRGLSFLYKAVFGEVLSDAA